MHRQILQGEIGIGNTYEQNEKMTRPSKPSMNFNIDSYQFKDLDLEIAVNKLSKRDQNILILRLMGHTQNDIAKASGGVTRSMISKRLRIIMNALARYL